MTKSIRRIAKTNVWALALALSTPFTMAQAAPTAAPLTPFQANSAHLPLEIGVLAQGGFGLTDRSSFKFLMAGVHAGKVLTPNIGPGPLHGNFEYAVEVFPFWQSYTPKFQRAMCTAPNVCSAPYTVGGTFTGASITPIILRWNFTGSHRITPWIQGGGGVLWTNHKYPAFGGPPFNQINDGPNSDASVWNFTPQAGLGAHYFISPRRSVDFGLNAVHISSASLGDKNPGVNASLQFSIGYTWWK
ncbi:MAG: Deacylase [Edaphobacter sp.]|nr:Deacylase [Edaphobacter sp.]